MGRDTEQKGSGGDLELERLEGRIAELEAQLRSVDTASATAQMFQRVIDTLPVRVFWKDKTGRYLGCNQVFAEDAGKQHPGELIGQDDYVMGWHEQAELYRADDKAVIDSGESKLAYEEPQTTPEGKTIWLRTSKIPLRDEEGEVIGVLGTYEDITAERVQRDQLLHREKLEALGRLAGGVAHDFNNLLSAILGSVDLLQLDRGAQESMSEPLETIREAGERAAELTKQLLGFARKQVIKPLVLDPNAAILQVSRLLVRLLGETIEVKLALVDDPWTIRMDPGQLEQLLVNLAVNARDAMPEGGKLTIETQNVELGADYHRAHPAVKPGCYVQLMVSDTGEGIDDETRSRIFEPFFTTKSAGHGTGLGLATCQGILEQNGAHIWVYSEPGQGSSFKILLPRAREKRQLPPPESTLARGDETVLVIEDDELLRDVTVAGLRMLGYQVLPARSGSEARLLAQTHASPIQAALCDVVLPDCRGPELAEQIKALHAELKVIFTSGYTENSIVDHGFLRQGFEFLPKPYTPAQAGCALRRVLDAAAPGDQSSQSKK